MSVKIYFLLRVQIIHLVPCCERIIDPTTKYISMSSTSVQSYSLSVLPVQSSTLSLSVSPVQLPSHSSSITSPVKPSLYTPSSVSSVKSASQSPLITSLA